jgi:ABC-type lipoprotein export system ATPase subunit
MSGYQGMRWFKCDLQVQTPEDGRHWDPEDPLRLPSPRDEQDLQEKARRYLTRCHEVGLEVIGVTDHNFCGHREPRERFLAHLIEQNRTVAEDMGREPLWIFPGFEVDIGYHVLCLFSPLRRSAGLDEICDVLTHLGLPPKSRFEDNRPTELRRDDRFVALSELLRMVQDESGGIVIAAHAFREDGIASESRDAKDYLNEDLLCVEVTSFPLGPREGSVLEANSGVWKRGRPPAYIRSSDAKSTLTTSNGQPKANSLGYRFTWIKMSEPSIEALRQAFLDAKSRIRLEGDPRVVEHGWIKSLKVENVVFLADQEIIFSPGLSCLIGGRGSGKSTLFEYIRFAVRQEADEAAASQVARIRETLKADSSLRLEWRERDDAEGAQALTDVFEYRPAVGRSQVVSREVTDASTIFQGLGVQIFSQREITEISRRSDFLLTLIDGLVGMRLRPPLQEETELKEKIREFQGHERTLDRLRRDESALAQEVQELERRWSARAAIQEEQRRQRAAQEAGRYLDDLEARTAAFEEDLGKWATDVIDSHSPLGSVVRNWPEQAYFESLDHEVERAKQDLAEELHRAAARYRERIRELTTSSPDWMRAQDSLKKAENEFREACARQGLRPEDLEQLIHLDAQRKAKSLELDAKRSQAMTIERSVQDLPHLWKRLFEVWRRQTAARREGIQQILSGPAVPRIERPEGVTPVIEVQVDFQGDRGDFLDKWRDLAPDARTRLGKQWDELGTWALDKFLQAPEVGSPWEVVQGLLNETINLSSMAPDVLQALRQLLQGVRADAWASRRLSRVRDAVDLVLYRNDGTKAGSLSQRQLSDGQTNTAVLMLLLASGQGPILIDQPEDELDSNFIYQQLVPLLRGIKKERQVIVVTHNPNLPVNGDADLVYALTAKAVDDRARGVVLAQGGLDKPAVKQAVLNIMEGSEEAFRLRGEKYHF